MVNALLAETRYLIDSLPYIDTEFNDPLVKKKVESMVKQEMTKFKPEDYLAHMPNYEPQFKEKSLNQTEYKRVSKGIESIPMDTTRYRVEPPSGLEKKKPAAWKKAVQNAEAQLEHQGTKIMNLELLQKYGGQSWKLLTMNLTDVHQTLEGKLKALETEGVKLNVERKRNQILNQEKLQRLSRKRDQLVERQLDVKIAVAQAEREVKRLKPSEGEEQDKDGNIDMKD